jgi:hypothetical protein
MSAGRRPFKPPQNQALAPTEALMNGPSRVLITLFACLILAGCADGSRFVGPLTCSTDGSVVWWEYPNKSGSFDGLNNNQQNCATRR